MCEDVDETRYVCNDVPNDECKEVPTTVTNYVDDQKCSYKSNRKCLDTTKLECTDVKKEIPREIEVEECIIDYIKDCPITYGYGNQPVGNEPHQQEAVHGTESSNNDSF